MEKKNSIIMRRFGKVFRSLTSPKKQKGKIEVEKIVSPECCLLYLLKFRDGKRNAVKVLYVKVYNNSQDANALSGHEKEGIGNDFEEDID